MPLSRMFDAVVALFSVLVVVSRVVGCIGILGQGCSLITTTLASFVVFFSRWNFVYKS